MKIFVIYILLFVFSIHGGMAQKGQTSDREKLGHYRERYVSGERSREFLKEYVIFVTEKKKWSDLQNIADSYLKTVPARKRYTADNLNLFLKGVKDYNAITFRELIEDWDKRVTAENRELLSRQVDDIYRNKMFYTILNKQKLSDDFAAMMRDDFTTIGLQDKKGSLLLLDMVVAAGKENVPEIMDMFRKYIAVVELRQLKEWTDAVLLNNILSVVLEKCDQKQCREMIRILQPLSEENEKFVINSFLDDFNGKMMMFEGTAVKVTLTDKKNDGREENDKLKKLGGLRFNTSHGGIATDSDYDFLRKIFSSDDDTLKQKHLRTVMQVFRYNGYTPGLASLESLIRRNVKESGEKQEVLSRYVTYAHLAPGKPAPEFKLRDVEGKLHALSGYRGKVVVVDVWATWCGGCINKLPYFLKIREKYEKCEDIVFLVISIDQKAAYNKWKFAHSRYGLTEVTSLIAHPETSSFSKDYNITGIPRYWIIDREGKIVNVYAPAPDNEEFEKIITKTLAGSADNR